VRGYHRGAMPQLRSFTLLAALAACKVPNPPPDDGGLPGPTYGIDAGFLFGAAVGGYQVEGGDDSSDWNSWQSVRTSLGGCPVLDCAQADQGPDFADHAGTDLSAAAQSGLNAFRFSLEWERLAPTPAVDGGYDPAALAYYHALLDTALDAGLTPMVTLSQGALPDWIHGLAPSGDGGPDGGFDDGSSPNGWLGGWRGLPGEDAGPTSNIVQAFGQYAADMATEFGDQVHLWITLDVPMHHAQDAYLTGVFPPGGQDRLSDLQQAVINLAYANAAAYDAIHAALPPDGGAQVLVGSSNLFQIYVPASDAEPDAGYAAAQLLSDIGNFLLPDAFTNGDLDPFFQGACNYTVAVPWAGCAQPGLAGRADFIGVAYAGLLSFEPGIVCNVQDPHCAANGVSLLELPGIASPLVGFDGGTTDTPVSLPIDPGDLAEVLSVVQLAYPLIPIFVTELSLNENEMPDTERARYLVAATQSVQEAMANGVDVRGIFYRSLLDDFEWQYGFVPETGLWSVNFTQASRPRTETLGAQAFGAISKAGGVTPMIEQQYGQ
jgi:beta-glucosidase